MSLHRRSLTFFTPPPPPVVPPPHSSSTNLSPSFLIIAIILIFVFLVSASIHFLLRFLNRRCNAFSRDHDDVDVASNEPVHVPHISSRRVAPEDHQNKTLIDSLPLFSFNSLSALRSSPSADCAVCLSKFEPHDQLRLLPLCCHAFHSTCIDTWLASNHTCPLCRSTIHVHESDRYLKLLSSSSSSPPPPSSESFRVEIGNVSSRRVPSDSGNRRSYSIGSFEYLVEDETTEIVVERKKDEPPPPPPPLPLQAAAAAAANVPLAPGAELAEEVAGGGRGWLRDYVDRLAANSTTSSSISSQAVSFRCSGRFFTGSSRRSEGFTGSSRRSTNGSGRGGGGGSWDLEGNQYGEEIGGFLRWLSGV